ncbi:fibronectin type III domain-containing protein [Paenibacillus mucilaginosus]|uniref:ChiA1 n=1 Tax=Paenibacillus mucilaginosus (strain KNP414) TaxID=1036673 RepID=F8FJE2_PAEMK|nr:fibronectin type III domain-containing protein [Paenibacillus mucilaginosus]AEI39905.1 ChiA1 [Paenibacillus mucilaginosus KNP414]MCG7217224.1 fibronectin type III domain-containing protein [Paenibacillus mucilaginosus]WDM29179.1 fibronectin type III domain-containing protein [Paenibacillus mucilaginosus]
MRNRFWMVVMGMLVVLLLPLQARAQEDMQLEIREPSAGGSYSKELPLTVWVTSAYEVTEVVAHVEGRETKLSALCGNGCTSYSGTLALDGLPYGELTLVVKAANLMNQHTETQLKFYHNATPQVELTVPIENHEVVRGPLHLAVRASDEDGVNRFLVRIPELNIFDPYPQEGAEAEAVLDRTLDLQAYNGQSVTLLITAFDSRNQGTEIRRTLHIEMGPNLTPVEHASGRILDMDSERLLYLSNHNSLVIQQRSDRTETEIWKDEANPVVQAYLTPAGALFTVTHEPNDTPVTEHQAYLFHDGQLTRLTGEDHPRDTVYVIPPKDGFAVYTKSGASYLVNTLTGERQLLPERGTAFHLLSAGTLLYHNGQAMIRRDVTGKEETAVPEVFLRDIVSDGQVILFSTDYTINKVAGDQFVTLSRTDSPLTVPRAYRDYQTNGGWIAYNKFPARRVTDVYLQSPEGAEKRLTFFGTATAIDYLAPDGTVSYKANGKTYIHPAGSEQGTYAASAGGRTVYMDGQWYKLFGNTVFQMQSGPADTSAPQWPAGEPLTSTDVKASEASLSWQPATDNVGVKLYNIYVGGQLTASVPGTKTSYTLTGLTPSTAYEVKVEAVDAAGNASAASPVITVTTLKEVPAGQAPYWNDPAGALTVSGVTYDSVQLQWQHAVDPTGIAKYSLWKGSELLHTVSGEVYSYRVTGLLPGTSYTFSVTAENPAGLVSLNNPTVTAVTYGNGGGEPLPGGKLSLQLKQGMLKVGSVAEVTVRADQASDLYAFLTKVQYDPSKLRLGQVLLAGEFGKEGTSATLTNYVNQAAGRVQLTGSLLGQQAGKSGSVPLVVLKFVVLQNGPATVGLTPEASIADSEGNVVKLTEPVQLQLQIGGKDFDGDGRVALSDLVLIAGHYGEGAESGFDLNHNGRVDLSDIQAVANEVAAAE